MYLHAQNVDDLLRKVFEELLKTKSRVNPTKGENGEIFGVLLELKNPRARLSRAETRSVVFSCIGEFLWYMSGRDDVDFVKYFVGKKYEQFAEKDGTVNGAYGPRIFNKDGIDQLDFVIKKLKENPASRKAIIQLYDARDTQKAYKDVPCTCTLQFVLRNGQLHMLTHMRSNDAYIGLPHDIFCFTMIQEIVAVILEARLGTYKHSVGSLHLYDENSASAQEYIDEGFQDNRPMPPIPSHPPLTQIRELLNIEDKIRSGTFTESSLAALNDYWADWARLILVKATKSATTINKLKSEMKSDVYETYVRRRHRSAKNKADARTEQSLFPTLAPTNKGK